jgi:hypothetical protein
MTGPTFLKRRCLSLKDRPTIAYRSVTSLE